MKKLLSIKYTDLGVNISMLLMRLAFGILMIPGGYEKLIGYSENKNDFMHFMGLSGPISLAMLIFAEFFCSILLVAGLFTRLACIPLMIAMSVALFDAHSGDIFGKGKMAGFYLISYVVILIIGPGKFSLDKFLSK